MSTYASRRRYGAPEIEAFLLEVDRHLTTKVRIVLLGGGAAAIHGATSSTSDLDTFTATTSELDAAVLEARGATGLEIPLSQSTVAEVPWDFETRLIRRFPELLNLEVMVLEKHDLALSKMLRGFDHDLRQLREVHERDALSLETLVERYCNEMSHVVGDPTTRRQNFLGLIEDLFGSAVADRADRILAAAGR